MVDRERIRIQFGQQKFIIICFVFNKYGLTSASTLCVPRWGLTTPLTSGGSMAWAVWMKWSAMSPRKLRDKYGEQNVYLVNNGPPDLFDTALNSMIGSDEIPVRDQAAELLKTVSGVQPTILSGKTRRFASPSRLLQIGSGEFIIRSKADGIVGKYGRGMGVPL